MIISLIGYRGTGKSTVGERLAKRLSLPFYDSDREITDRQGKSIAAIFSTQGEAGFRAMETDAVQELMKISQGVIAWGGGVVLNEKNRQAIRCSERTIWLCATPETICERLLKSDQGQVTNSDENRPRLTGLAPAEEIRVLASQREALYRQCADETITTDELTADEIVEEIVRKLDSGKNKLSI